MLSFCNFCKQQRAYDSKLSAFLFSPESFPTLLFSPFPRSTSLFFWQILKPFFCSFFYICVPENNSLVDSFVCLMFSQKTRRLSIGLLYKSTKYVLILFSLVSEEKWQFLEHSKFIFFLINMYRYHGFLVLVTHQRVYWLWKWFSVNII